MVAHTHNLRLLVVAAVLFSVGTIAAPVPSDLSEIQGRELEQSHKGLAGLKISELGLERLPLERFPEFQGVGNAKRDISRRGFLGIFGKIIGKVAGPFINSVVDLLGGGGDQSQQTAQRRAIQDHDINTVYSLVENSGKWTQEQLDAVENDLYHTITGITPTQVKSRGFLKSIVKGGRRGVKLGSLTRHIIGIVHSIAGGPSSTGTSTVDSTSSSSTTEAASATETGASEDTAPADEAGDDTTTDDATSDGTTSERRALKSLNALD